MDRKKQKKNTDSGTRMSRRMGIVILFLLLAFIAVTVRLFYILVFDGSKYSETVLSQTETELTKITAKRGDIIDRNNIVFATSNVTYNLILDPKVILSDEDRFLDPTVALVAECFGYSEEELRTKINERSTSSYVVLKKNLSFNQVEDFINKKAEDRNVAGIWLEENYQRNYSFSQLASSVIGFTSNGNGIFGVELSYNDELTGTDGREYTYVNSENEIVTERKEAEDGNTVMLTIDYNIQTIVEKKIEEFKEMENCGTVAVVIQNPNTGEIYAMADSDNFDCNSPWNLTVKYTQEEIDAMDDEEVSDALNGLWRNFCVTDTYEPGSTFKPFTLAACFEENVVKMDDTFYCIGYKEFLEDTIKCHENEGHGTVDTKYALADSCNVALMEMGARLGAVKFCEYQAKFGFGKYTGIDLPNETSCKYLLYSADKMIDVDLATNSFGQNFNLTMIQLSTAFCSLINGGYYYQPYICKAIYSSAGDLIESTDKTLVTRTVSEETSDKIKECLRRVVTDGTGDYAAIDGYVISGKTGTAEKAGRVEGNYLISFVGFAPYENPEVVCYVVIDEPEAADEHGVSSVLFNMIMSEILPYMNVTPATLDTDPDNGEQTVSTYSKEDTEENGEDTKEAGEDNENTEDEEDGGYDGEDNEENYEDYDPEGDEGSYEEGDEEN